MKTLDIGCGNIQANWKGDGLDKKDFGQKYIIDLEDVREWTEIPNESYDACYLNHVLEHLWNPEACYNVMNQIWRVLKPNGLFIGEAPHYIRSPNYTRDFYHLRPVSEHTFDAMLEGSAIHLNDYPIHCKWRKVNYGVIVNANNDVQWMLQKAPL